MIPNCERFFVICASAPSSVGGGICTENPPL